MRKTARPVVWEGDRAQSRSLYLIRGAHSEAVTDQIAGVWAVAPGDRRQDRRWYRGARFEAVTAQIRRCRGGRSFRGSHSSDHRRCRGGRSGDRRQDRRWYRGARSAAGIEMKKGAAFAAPFLTASTGYQVI